MDGAFISESLDGSQPLLTTTTTTTASYFYPRQAHSLAHQNVNCQGFQAVTDSSKKLSPNFEKKNILFLLDERSINGCLSASRLE